MKTAEEIYQENGCDSKRDIIEAMKEYAKEVAKQSLVNACEAAVMCDKFSNDIGKFSFNYNGVKIFINKQSILNESNIPEL